MKILVINTGSSSIKYRLFQMPGSLPLAAGLLERIGEKGGKLTHRDERYKRPLVVESDIPDHKSGLQAILNLLLDPTNGCLREPSEIKAVGHRVVHGGEMFHEPTLITDDVIKAIEEHAPLAPLHNPPNAVGIRSARELFPGSLQVAVFDTAFHQTLPPHSFHYALPRSLYREHRVRRYGFHGTSHGYVARRAAEHLRRDLRDCNLITIHLGNGASMSAVKNGRCTDTSMGLTPLEGLIMGTRSGDVDPALHFYLARNAGMDLPEIEKVLNRESGLLGLAGSNDMRDILKRYESGDDDARLAVTMFCYRLKKYIGAYYAVLGKPDAIVFTAGIGENSPQIRALTLEGLEALDIHLDPEKNARSPDDHHSILEIQRELSGIRLLIIPTDEEREIADQTMSVISSPGPGEHPPV